MVKIWYAILKSLDLRKSLKYPLHAGPFMISRTERKNGMLVKRVLHGSGVGGRLSTGEKGSHQLLSQTLANTKIV